MEYYARKSGHNKEFLKDHLKKTSLLCEEYMTVFDMPVTGRVLGRLHDIGKRTEKFQDVLFGDKVKINHAIVAGMLLNSCFKKYWPDVADIVTSHHHGLHKGWPYYPDFKNPLSLYDLENKENALKDEPEWLDIQKWMHDVGIELTKSEAISMLNEFKRIYGKTNNERMFINRMLFSCLVDADYSASASFDDPTYLTTYEGKELNPKELLKKLELYRNDLISKSTSNSELNALRNEVFNNCSLSGNSNFGNYTLTAPTGTAKTLATLEFALRNADFNNKQRIIFVLPYLSIIEQNAKIYKEICGQDVVLEDDSQTQFTEESKLLSERWSAPIIVTTAVTFFETLFRCKGSDLRKLHNIANSVVVFDESQTIPNEILDATMEVLDVLNKKFNVTTVFSTATPPSFGERQNITTWDPHEIIPNPQSLFDRYAEIKKLSVDWNIEKDWTYNDLFDNTKDKDSFLVIFNLKRHAAEFYQKLNQEPSIDKEGLFYITTNLCSFHRTMVLKTVKERLSKGLPTKVISTQCLEAGVDLDFQYVYRAFGPATSIAQAAGRCSRNALFPGKLTVFIPSDTKRLYPDSAYKNSTLQLETLICQNDGFDINSLKDIDQYYHHVFNTRGLNADKAGLTEAINKFSYEDVSQEYKLIAKQGSTVIVPCPGQEDLYQTLKQEIIENDYCITKSMMVRAQQITVTSYNTNDTNAYCQELFLNVKGKKVHCNWYFLDDSIGCYDEVLGLNFAGANALIF